MVHFIPTTEKMTVGRLARLFKNNVWKLHGLSKSIISDRGPPLCSRSNKGIKFNARNQQQVVNGVILDN